MADAFTYRDQFFSWGSFHEQFGTGWLLSAAASRDLGRHFSIQLETGYLHYRRQLSIVTTPEIQPPVSHLSAQFLPLAAGVRYYPRSPSARGPRPYFQLLPAVFVSRWAERNEYAGGTDFYGNYHSAHTEKDAFVKFLPGFGAGLGFEGPFSGPVRLDVGARYVRSVGPGNEEIGQFSSGDFEGLRQMGLVGSIRVPI